MGFAAASRNPERNPEIAATRPIHGRAAAARAGHRGRGLRVDLALGREPPDVAAPLEESDPIAVGTGGPAAVALNVF